MEGHLCACDSIIDLLVHALYKSNYFLTHYFIRGLPCIVIQQLRFVKFSTMTSCTKLHHSQARLFAYSDQRRPDRHGNIINCSSGGDRRTLFDSAISMNNKKIAQIKSQLHLIDTLHGRLKSLSSVQETSPSIIFDLLRQLDSILYDITVGVQIVNDGIAQHEALLHPPSRDTVAVRRIVVDEEHRERVRLTDRANEELTLKEAVRAATYRRLMQRRSMTSQSTTSVLRSRRWSHGGEATMSTKIVIAVSF